MKLEYIEVQRRQIVIVINEAKEKGLEITERQAWIRINGGVMELWLPATGRSIGGHADLVQVAQVMAMP